MLKPVNKINLESNDLDNKIKETIYNKTSDTFMVFNIKNFHEYSGFITAVDAYGNTGLGSSLFKFDGPKRPKSPKALVAVFNPETSSILCTWEDLAIPQVRYNLYYTTLVRIEHVEIEHLI